MAIILTIFYNIFLAYSFGCFLKTELRFFLQNQTQVATALQVFHNLGSLQQTVETFVQSLREDLKTTIANTLDIQNLMYPQNGKYNPSISKEL